MEGQGEADGAEEVRDRPQQHEAGRERNHEHKKGGGLDDPEHDLGEKLHEETDHSDAGDAGEEGGRSALFFVLFFLGRAEPSGGTESLAEVVDRKFADVHLPSSRSR